MTVKMIPAAWLAQVGGFIFAATAAHFFENARPVCRQLAAD